MSLLFHTRSRTGSGTGGLPLGEYTLRLMGTGLIPLLCPVIRSVSASISWRTSSKSVNFFPLQCRNSAYSAQRHRCIPSLHGFCHTQAMPQKPAGMLGNRHLPPVRRVSLKNSASGIHSHKNKCNINNRSLIF